MVDQEAAGFPGPSGKREQTEPSSDPHFGPEFPDLFWEVGALFILQSYEEYRDDGRRGNLEAGQWTDVPQVTFALTRAPSRHPD